MTMMMVIIIISYYYSFLIVVVVCCAGLKCPSPLYDKHQISLLLGFLNNREAVAATLCSRAAVADPGMGGLRAPSIDQNYRGCRDCTKQPRTWGRAII